MSTRDPRWFDVLAVDPADVARVGSSLMEYAFEYEALDLELVRDDDDGIERALMLATTLADAGTLLAVTDQPAAVACFGEAALLYELALAPEAWTFGLASGRWRPAVASTDDHPLPPPSGAISSIASVYLEQERELGEYRTLPGADDYSWGDAGMGWSEAGVPAELFAQFASFARERQLDGMVDVLDRIAETADVAIRFVQEVDRWRWRRFLTDVPLIDPELLALGCVAARADHRVFERVQDQELSPARVGLLAGMVAGLSSHL